MDTRDAQRPLRPGERPHNETPEEPGLGRWIKRNPWLLVRLFMVIVFSFGATATAANFSYGLKINPIPLTVEQINNGELPSGTKLNDYVEITGTPDYGANTTRLGNQASKIGLSSRYSASYFYFGLKETGDHLLIQTAQSPPDVTKDGKQVWRGKLSNVGTVIFHNTTKDGLKRAGLPHGKNIPVVETGDTPNYYRQIFPAYSTILGLWVLSIAWLIWKKNKPFMDS